MFALTALSNAEIIELRAASNIVERLLDEWRAEAATPVAYVQGVRAGCENSCAASCTGSCADTCVGSCSGTCSGTCLGACCTNCSSASA